MILQVHLDDPETGALSYRPVVHGARWRGGFRSIGDVCRDAEKATGTDAYTIDYVTEKA